jgi:hypothetical protein
MVTPGLMTLPLCYYKTRNNDIDAACVALSGWHGFCLGSRVLILSEILARFGCGTVETVD